MAEVFWGLDEQDTITAALARAVERWPGKPFIQILDDASYTYAEVDRESTRLAHGLRAAGLKAGATIITMLDNNIDCIALWLAANKLNAIWVPVNTAYKGEFLRHLIADADAEIIVTEADYADRVLAISDELPRVRLLLHRDAVEPGRDARFRIQPLDEIRSDDASPIADEARPGDVAMLIFTGGTTGPSKACMISHNYCINHAHQTLRGTLRTADEVHFTTLPMFHFNAVSTTLTASMLIGGQASVGTRFSVSRFWPDVERTGARLVTLLGSMPVLVGQAAENDAMKRCHGQVRVVRGAPFPGELQAIYRERFGIRHVGSGTYGLTEATMLTSISVDEYWKPGSSGKRNSDFDVRIVDDEGVECPPGVPGEVIARPLKPNIMFSGYWRRPAETLSILKDLWIRSGDIGMFDEDGFFFFVDRKKDYMRRRGENISSYEMESAFRKHPAIVDVAVHAVLADVGEDDVKVTCVLDEAFGPLSEEELCRWSTDHLPYFAVPRFIEFRTELPRNPVGRILKHQLRDEGRTVQTWDREESGFELTRR